MLTAVLVGVVVYLAIGSCVIAGWWERDHREGRLTDPGMPLWVLFTLAVVAWPAMLVVGWGQR